MDGSGSVRGLDAAGFTGIDLARRGAYGTTAAGVWLGSNDPS
jgi:hypothetical protein